MKLTKLFVVFMALGLAACSAPKKLYYPSQLPPSHVEIDNIRQVSLGTPPLLRPTGKRKTISTRSQFFTLAIPNGIDMTGRAKDLRKSLADMMYTKLFQTRRFNLYDRQELVNLDTDWLEMALQKSADVSLENLQANESLTAEGKGGKGKESRLMDEIVAGGLRVREEKRDEAIQAEKLKADTDGLLLMYITARTGKKEGGHFVVDYRIVSSDTNNKTVLFAGSQKIQFAVSTAEDIEYNRDDIEMIATNIINVFPNPDTARKGQIVSLGRGRFVIDLGREDQLIPGLRGYVVARDDSIYTSDAERAQHYGYLCMFQIVEVYDKTSTVVVVDPLDWDPALKVGDEVVLK
ncbi:MAG: hypothetical protein RQ753_00470 [Desulfurivibrionaceae bacterium]|nr:hypothetical protein [Desulfobulbales bacterium]MDT8334149.1 hypothetical protein [Desulfurivibrionaceae bacterium]